MNFHYNWNCRQKLYRCITILWLITGVAMRNYLFISFFFSQKLKKKVLTDILICIEKVAKASSNIKQLQSVGSLLMLMWHDKNTQLFSPYLLLQLYAKSQRSSIHQSKSEKASLWAHFGSLYVQNLHKNLFYQKN